MSKYSLLILIGFLVALFPHFGFPNSFDTPVFAVLGLTVIFLAILVRRDRGRSISDIRPEKAPMYAESKPARPRRTREKKMAPSVPPQVDVVPPPSTFTDVS